MKRNYFSLACFLFLFFSATNARAQEDGALAIGLQYQPFFFWKYNASEWDDMPQSFPVKPGRFNGHAMGLNVSWGWTGPWGVKSGLFYSAQQQEHQISTVLNGDSMYLYNGFGKARLQYLHLPFFMTVRTEIGVQSGVFIQAFAGPQVSFLTHYRGEYKQYSSNQRGDQVNFDELEIQKIIEPRKFYQEFLETSGDRIYETYDTDWVYNRWELAMVAGFALQKEIAQTYLISLGCQVDYGITNPENRTVGKESKEIDPNIIRVTHGGSTGASGFPEVRPNSRNIRFGLQLSIQHLF